MTLAKPYQAYFASPVGRPMSRSKKVAACFVNTNDETHAMVPRGVSLVVMAERFEKIDPLQK